jgi:hypothetical protein
MATYCDGDVCGIEVTSRDQIPTETRFDARSTSRGVRGGMSSFLPGHRQTQGCSVRDREPAPTPTKPGGGSPGGNGVTPGGNGSKPGGATPGSSTTPGGNGNGSKPAVVSTTPGGAPPMTLPELLARMNPTPTFEQARTPTPVQGTPPAPMPQSPVTDDRPVTRAPTELVDRSREAAASAPASSTNPLEAAARGLSATQRKLGAAAAATSGSVDTVRSMPGVRLPSGQLDPGSAAYRDKFGTDDAGAGSADVWTGGAAGGSKGGSTGGATTGQWLNAAGQALGMTGALISETIRSGSQERIAALDAQARTRGMELQAQIAQTNDATQRAALEAQLQATNQLREDLRQREQLAQSQQQQVLQQDRNFRNMVTLGAVVVGGVLLFKVLQPKSNPAPPRPASNPAKRGKRTGSLATFPYRHGA